LHAGHKPIVAILGLENRWQFRPDNFCDPASAKYRGKYAEIARPPTRTELGDSWRHARELGLKFETATFEGRNGLGLTSMLELW